MELVGPLVLLICAATFVSGSPRIHVLAPNVLREGQDTQVFITTSGVQPGAVVKLKLGNGNEKSVPVANNVVPTTIRVTKGMLGDADDQGRHYVNLRATCSAHNFQMNQRILVNLKTASVFIQTDKPIYRPDEFVRIRVYTVTNDLNAMSMDVRIEIQNADGLALKREELPKASQKNGIYDYNYKLPKFVNDGNWTVVASYGKDYAANTTTTIEVRDYVLPHFDVSIAMDNDFISKQTRQISGKVFASHSFSSVLSLGHLRLVFRIVDGDDAELIPSAIQNKILSSGRSTFSLDLNQHLYSNGQTFESFLGKKLQVEAAVTERSSGIRETTISRDCSFVTSPYIITFENTPWNFAPKVPFRFEARIGHISGGPAEKVPVLVSAVNQANTPIPNSNNAATVSRTSDKQGRIEHTFNVPVTTRVLKINVTTVKANEPSSVRVFEVQRMNAPGYIHIDSVVGQYHEMDTVSGFTVTLTGGGNVPMIYTTVVSGGRIIETKQNNIGGATATNLNVRIRSEMTPSFRLIIWYITSNNQLVAASRSYDVEKKCRNEVTMENDNPRLTEARPDERTTLKITGHAQSTVAMVAVDKAVYYLNNKEVLDRSKFFTIIGSNDLGCGAGGGPSPADLFKLSGVSLLGNTRSQTTQRESLSCQPRDPHPAGGRKKRSIPESDGENSATMNHQCCQRGGRYGKSATTPMSRQAARSAYCASGRTTADLPSQSKFCKNSFYKCCVENATDAYLATLPKSARSSANVEQGREVDELIAEAKEINPRKNFKETWLFDTKTVPANGVLRMQVTLPSPITTWIIQTVSMSPTGGMCIANPYRLPVKKPLFIKLHLPKTAAIGEHLQLKATIYNTMTYEVFVNVLYKGTEGLCTEAKPGKMKILRRRAKIRSGQSLGVSWLAVPTTLGDVKVTLTVLGIDRDSVERTLTIVPSGSRIEAPVMILTQAPAQTGNYKETNDNGLSANVTIADGIQRNTLMLGLPDDAIGNGYHMRMELTGNPMMEVVEARTSGVNTYKNHPSNCGEQTMAKLGQTVYSALYIRDSGLGLMTRDLEVKLRQNIDEGIDIMVNQYRSTGGSFTVWRGYAPILWLTAFTLKTLAHTKDFSDKMITTPKVLSDASNFILSKQHTTGSWIDTGRQVAHKDMVGGVGKDEYLLTAYMLICLLESGTPPKNAKIEKGVTYLLNNVGPHSSNYKLAQTAYVLALAKHNRAQEILGWLNNKAQVVGGTVKEQKFWTYGPIPKGARNSKSQLELETNGYGLLALVAMDKIEDSAPHVEWIIRQKKSGGLFPSTQAHVVSIQALTKYSIRAPNVELNIECRMTAGGTRETFAINDENLGLGQSMDLTKYVNTRVFLDCSGRGTALVTFKTFYYGKTTLEDRCAFKIEVVAFPKENTNNEQEDLKNMVIKVCARTQPHVNKTGMAIIDVGLGTGYSPQQEDLDKLKNDGVISMYEAFDRSIAFYLDVITAAKVCIEFGVTNELDIEAIRPVPVKVYDYYEPDQKQCAVFYNPHGGDQDARIDVDCEENRKTCVCLENNCPTSYGFERGDELPKSFDELMHFACVQLAADRPDYVMAMEVIDEPRTDETGIRFTNMKILDVYNQDEMVVAELVGTPVTFYMGGSCPIGIPRLEVGKKYIIMGKESSLSTGSKYFFDSHSYVGELMASSDIRRLQQNEQKKRARAQKKFRNELKNRGCRENP